MRRPRGQRQGRRRTRKLCFAQAYHLSDSTADGGELLSLIRYSNLDPDALLDRFFDTGSRRQQQSSTSAAENVQVARAQVYPGEAPVGSRICAPRLS